MALLSGRTTSIKPSKNVTMFLISLLLGGTGVFYSKQYIETQISAHKNALEVEETLVEVVVPARSMRIGELVTQADLTIRAIPEQYVDLNTLTESTFEEAVGQRVEFDLERGKPILWAHLEGGQVPTFSGKVPSGLRAMTIRVDEINSISGFLQPKDKIDLLLTFGEKSSKQIIPLIQNLNVIATGMQTHVDKQNLGNRSFTTITIQVSPDQAQKITLSQHVGKITAMLRNPDDESSLGDNPMSLAKILNLPVPKVKAKPKPVKRRAPKPKKAQIEYIIGMGS